MASSRKSSRACSATNFSARIRPPDGCASCRSSTPSGPIPNTCKRSTTWRRTSASWSQELLAPAAAAACSRAPAVYLAESTSGPRRRTRPVAALAQAARLRGAAAPPAARARPRAAPGGRRPRWPKRALAVHLIGANYGAVPEEETASIAEIQAELATARGNARSRLQPAGLAAAGRRNRNPRQLALVERLRDIPAGQRRGRDPRRQPRSLAGPDRNPAAAGARPARRAGRGGGRRRWRRAALRLPGARRQGPGGRRGPARRALRRQPAPRGGAAAARRRGRRPAGHPYRIPAPVRRHAFLLGRGRRGPAAQQAVRPERLSARAATGPSRRRRSGSPAPERAERGLPQPRGSPLRPGPEGEAAALAPFVAKVLAAPGPAAGDGR